jgi:tRNA(fMet)-specific endonuclease VapC
MSFVIDTDTCSAYLKGNPLAWKRFQQYAGNLHVSTVSLAELFAWALRAKAPPRRLQSLLSFLNSVRPMEVTLDIARKFGEIQAGLLDSGKSAPGLDLLIGATAIVYGFRLITHNIQDFANIPGLSIEDWLIP